MTTTQAITTRAQLDSLAQEHGIPTYSLSDDLQACNLDDIKEVLQVSDNYLLLVITHLKNQTLSYTIKSKESLSK